MARLSSDVACPKALPDAAADKVVSHALPHAALATAVVLSAAFVAAAAALVAASLAAAAAAVVVSAALAATLVAAPLAALAEAAWLVDAAVRQPTGVEGYQHSISEPGVLHGPIGVLRGSVHPGLHNCVISRFSSGTGPMIK